MSRWNRRTPEGALDYWLLLPVLLLTILGLYVLRLVLQAGYGYGSYPGNFYKQCAAAMVGLVLALMIRYLEEPTLKLLSSLLYILSILLLIWVKIDSFSLARTTGADSWIQLPLIGTFQPSELAKVAVAMLGAEVLEKIKEGQIECWRGCLRYALVYGVPLILILREPDFGTSFVIILMMLCQIFVSGLSWRYIAAGAGAAVLFLPLLWFTYFNSLQRARILTLIFPSHELSDSFHIDQALKAIAAGGIAGRTSELDVYVPVKESDFIFSAISEHLGFVGTAVVIILTMFLIFRLFRLAVRVESSSRASAYTVVSLAAFLSAHFIENMGMNVGLLPITGIPLPFMSNGGTSMLINYLALGVLLNIAANDEQRRLD